MVAKKYIPERGDIIWLDLNPTRGHEEKGFRPALIVSPKIYNTKTGLALVCPITSHSKKYSFEVELQFTSTIGVILSDHIRSVDWKGCHARYIEKVNNSIIDEVEQKLLALITQ